MATYNHENGMVIPGQTWSIPENYFPGSLGNAKNVRSTEADFRSSFNMTQSGAAVLLNRAVTKALFRTVQAHKYPEVFSGFGAGSNCSVGEYQMLDDFTIPDTEEKKAAIAAAPVALCIYIPNDGSFYAGVAADKAAKVFPPVTPKHSNDVTNDTAYLLYGMMGYLMGDSELMSMVEGMVDNYEAYIKDPTSSEGKEFTRMMFVANDNIYRRLSTKKAGSGAPEVYTAACGLSNIKEAQVISGRYAPSEIYGELRFFAGETSPKTTGGHAKKNINEMCGMYAIPGVSYTEEEQRLIPHLPDSTVVTEEAIQIATTIRDSTNLRHPKRNFCLYGPSGLGKTTIAQQVAVLLGMPYLIQGCNSDMDAMDLVVQAVPESSVNELVADRMEEMPSAMDIAMDPVSSYQKICHVAKEDATEADCMRAMAASLCGKEGGSANRVRYERSNVLKGLTKPYFVEVQEPSTIQKQGALTVLNSMMDDCRQITLPDGTTLMRDPNAVLMMTTNLGYEGTRDMNQSVLSRCRKMHIDSPEKATIVAFMEKVTEIKDKKVLGVMVDVFNRVRTLCEENGITQGSCGYRELIDWADEAYLNGMELYESCKRTMLISAAVHNKDDYEEIEDTCLKPLIKI